ncbi:MAG: hypothetical protein HRU21_00775 [Pseudomonadales bacterium]|nr:hypothetical protein [Pseudomonadales bacterium]
MLQQRYWTHFFISLLSCYLYSCAMVQPNDHQRLQQQIDNQAFDQALATYDNMSELDRQAYDRDAINQQRQRYIQQCLKLARRSIGNKQWLSAQSELDNCLEKVASSKVLQTELIVLNRRIDRERARIPAQLLMLETQNYFARESLDDAWQANSAEPIPFLNPSFADAASKQAAANRLADYGQTLLSNDNQQGLVYIRTANQLSPNADWQKILKQSADRKAQQKSNARNREKRIREAKLKESQQQFAQNLKDGNIQQAQQSLQQTKSLISTDGEQRWYATAEQKLSQQTALAVQAYIDQGQQRYINGEVDAAIKLWQQGQLLAPDNRQLRDNLDRAEKFKQTYESLKGN